MAELEKHTVVVKVYNQDLRLRTTEPPDYVREIARYVDAKIFEIVDSTGSTSSSKSVILAALNIADELFRERETHRKLIEQLEQGSKAIEEKLSEIDIET